MATSPGKKKKKLKRSEENNNVTLQCPRKELAFLNVACISNVCKEIDFKERKIDLQQQKKKIIRESPRSCASFSLEKLFFERCIIIYALI